MRKKSFDPEFKKEIAQIYLSGTRNGQSLAEELGIHPNTIYRWAIEFEEDPENAFPGTGKQKPEDEEISKAQKRIKELEREVEILKQAAAYFAKNSR